MRNPCDHEVRQFLMEHPQAICIPTLCIYFVVLGNVPLHVFLYANEVDSHHLSTFEKSWPFVEESNQNSYFHRGCLDT